MDYDDLAAANEEVAQLRAALDKANADLVRVTGERDRLRSSIMERPDCVEHRPEPHCHHCRKPGDLAKMANGELWCVDCQSASMDM